MPSRLETKPTPITRFTSRAHVLVELGQRLVTKAEAAVAELVKNSYDADASWCKIELTGNSLSVSDDGHGMDEEAFLNHWMVVAADSKRTRHESRFFKRPLAGSKGLGRLSVAFLGNGLDLTSRAYDRKRKSWMELKVTFDWEALVKGDDLSDVPVSYTYEPLDAVPETRTVLRITGLRKAWTDKDTRALGTETAALCDPSLIRQLTPVADGAETTPWAVDFSKSPDSIDRKNDPGFSIYLPSSWQEGTSPLQAEMLKRAEVTLSIKTANGKVVYEIETEDESVAWSTSPLEFPLDKIGKVTGKIYVIPQGRDRFAGMTLLDGRLAKTWIREHCGVRVFWQGFRVFPYGAKDDDWLHLSIDKGHNRRQLRASLQGVTEIEKRFPTIAELAGQAASVEQKSVMLHLPPTTSVIGAISIEKGNWPEERNDVLIPAANRQGFVANEAFDAFQDLVRTGMELVAAARTELGFRNAKKEAAEDILELEEAFQEAIESAQANDDLPVKARAAVVAELRSLEKRVVSAQRDASGAIRQVEHMGLLGSLAAFMTHEMSELIGDLKALAKQFAKQDKLLKRLGLEELSEDVQLRVSQLSDQLEYITLFVGGRQLPPTQMSVWGQVELVIKRLRSVTEPRGITVANLVPRDLKTPAVPPTLLSGVLMNLFSNAVKWVIDERNTSGRKEVQFNAALDDSTVVIQISDTGPGVDPALKDLIFLPGFTTVLPSNPLHSGMGMGLHIVERLLKENGGKVRVAKPLAGFSTTFEVQLKRRES